MHSDLTRFIDGSKDLALHRSKPEYLGHATKTTVRISLRKINSSLPRRVYYALEIGRVPGHYLVTIDARTIRNTIDTQERRLNRVTRSLWPMNKRSIWRRWRSLRIHKVTITRPPIIINFRSSA